MSNIGKNIVIVDGRGSHILEDDTSQYTGQTGIVVREGVSSVRVIVLFPDGVEKSVTVPEKSDEAVWLEDYTPPVHEQYIEYIDSRIKSLTDSHEKWSEKEIGSDDQDRIHSSSVAAGIWDTVCELEKCKAMYKNCIIYENSKSFQWSR